MGVTLNTGGAESQVSQADQAYRSQNYEQAIRTASAAIQQIRQAHTVAVQQAFWRQMQVDAEPRAAIPRQPDQVLDLAARQPPRRGRCFVTP